MSLKWFFIEIYCFTNSARVYCIVHFWHVGMSITSSKLFFISSTLTLLAANVSFAWNQVLLIPDFLQYYNDMIARIIFTKLIFNPKHGNSLPTIPMWATGSINGRLWVWYGPTCSWLSRGTANMMIAVSRYTYEEGIIRIFEMPKKISQQILPYQTYNFNPIKNNRLGSTGQSQIH